MTAEARAAAAVTTPSTLSRIYGLGSVFGKTLRDSRRATIAVGGFIGLLLLVVSQAITWTATLVVTAALGWYLGAARFGDLYLAISLGTIFSVLVEFGLNQQIVRAVARDADVVLVVGSANSSNSKRLVEIATRRGTPAHLIDRAGDIDLAWLSGAHTVGLTAGASAPPPLVNAVVDALRGLGPVEVLERQVATESVRFTLPKEVRP